MGKKAERPALVQSAGHKAKLVVPDRKFDNGKYIVFDNDSKGADKIDRQVRSADSCRIDGGFRLRFEYLDKRRNTVAPSFRVYTTSLNGNTVCEFVPIEDVILFGAPGEHDPQAYDRARKQNSLARTEWRRIVNASFKGTCHDLGFDTEKDLDTFWSYLGLIENDDHAVLREFGFNPATVVAAKVYRDPELVLSDWRLWWRAPA